MSLRAGELDGKMEIQGEGGVMHKAESSRRRNVSFQKRVSKVGSTCWYIRGRHARVVAALSWRGICVRMFLGSRD